MHAQHKTILLAAQFFAPVSALLYPCLSDCGSAQENTNVIFQLCFKLKAWWLIILAHLFLYNGFCFVCQSVCFMFLTALSPASLSMKRCRVSLGKETGTQSFPQSRWVLLVYFERLIPAQWQSVNACSTCGLTTEYPALGTMSVWPLAMRIRSELQHPSRVSIFFRCCFRKCGVFAWSEQVSCLCFYSVFVSWKNGDNCVTGRRLKIPQRRQRHNSENLMKFCLVIVWCLVPCIYKII